MNEKSDLFSRLTKSRNAITRGLSGLLSSAIAFDESIYDDIEDQLIMSDMGTTVSHSIVSQIRARSGREKPQNTEQLLSCLKSELLNVLLPCEQPEKPHDSTLPRVTLMVGVNGVGKTTMLSKIAAQYKNQEQKVMMAACDTFRAAAIEQLKTWGKITDIPVIAQLHGADAAAVAFDALTAATARQVDHLLIDSAGRQHTHSDLMEQLSKIARVLAKVDATAPHEVLITVDAGNGQNVISQVENFNNVIPLTGLCITKLDGTAKGGVLLAVANQLSLPIRYIGFGEGIDDLKVFVASEYIDALLPNLSSLGESSCSDS